MSYWLGELPDRMPQPPIRYAPGQIIVASVRRPQPWWRRVIRRPVRVETKRWIVVSETELVPLRDPPGWS